MEDFLNSCKKRCIEGPVTILPVPKPEPPIIIDPIKEPTPPIIDPKVAALMRKKYASSLARKFYQ